MRVFEATTEALRAENVRRNSVMRTIVLIRTDFVISNSFVGISDLSDRRDLPDHIYRIRWNSETVNVLNRYNTRGCDVTDVINYLNFFISREEIGTHGNLSTLTEF